MSRVLPDGLYERVVTAQLADELAQVEAGRSTVLDDVEDADAKGVLARHLAREVERLLANLSTEDATELAGRLLGQIAELGAGRGLDAEVIRAQGVVAPARQLMAIHRAAVPERPMTPLSVSTLLTRNPSEPAIGHELAREIATADRIDAIVAFVTVGGIRRVREQLERFARAGDGSATRMRVLTTTFSGATEREALDMLARLPGVAVKVSYDVRRTRLHAKAWLFHRESEATTAYVGSANLTATALGDGHEWMMKVCKADLPHVIGTFAGTFETLWRDPEFEAYDPGDEGHRRRLGAALRAERGEASSITTLVALRPYPFQEEILDRLEVARRVHGRHRNLVIAATGTGKTVIAAVDYARLAQKVGVRPRLLFLAHRKEILERSRDTFRHALQDGAFGELCVGGKEPELFEHVFASIQGAGRLVGELGPQHFRHVIIDECHHLPADSYQAVIRTLQPEQLVGLTATPERHDGKSLLPDFGGHIAAELRLWHALDRQLLAPFDYYGVSDGTDLRRVRWSRSGYDLDELAGLYTGNQARADLVLAQLGERVADVRQVRALGFCVSVDHAEFMAAQFSARGVPAIAVHGGSDAVVREDAPRRLRAREVNVVFTCDLYNEGVDLPFVDTLLFLRPTSSATLFTQQLGRGLRLDGEKRSCLVLDFIGQHREEFRFDGVLAALTGLPRPRLREAAAVGFPFLPSGCSVVLDAQARERILDALRVVLGGAKRIAAELRELEASAGRPLRLAEFLEQSGRALDEVYGDHGWAKVRALAGGVDVDEDAADLSRRLGWMAHIDEPARLACYRAGVVGDAMDRVRWQMLGALLQHRGVLKGAEDVVAELGTPAARAELSELDEVLVEGIPLAEDRYPEPAWPLALHRHYVQREILVAVGEVVPGQKTKAIQAGVLGVDGKRELLFVTLDKSGRGFSPTTRYRDFAMSRSHFHWETQSSASVSKTGRRYVDPSLGWTFHLFVRMQQADAFAYLGPVAYESHEGDRPIAITWKLAHAMPAALFDRFATLQSG